MHRNHRILTQQLLSISNGLRVLPPMLLLHRRGSYPRSQTSPDSAQLIRMEGAQPRSNVEHCSVTRLLGLLERMTICSGRFFILLYIYLEFLACRRCSSDSEYVYITLSPFTLKYIFSLSLQIVLGTMSVFSTVQANVSMPRKWNRETGNHSSRSGYRP